MVSRFGLVVYWALTGLAVVIVGITVILVLWTAIFDFTHLGPNFILAIIAAIVAAISWMAGRAVLFVLSGD